jgi:hypothetical protein
VPAACDRFRKEMWGFLRSFSRLWASRLSAALILGVEGCNEVAKVSSFRISTGSCIFFLTTAHHALYSIMVFS